MQKRSVFLLSFLISCSQLVCMDLEPVTDDEDYKHDYERRLNPASESLSRASRLSAATLLTTARSDEFDYDNPRSDNRLVQALQKDVHSGKLNQTHLDFIVNNVSTRPLGFYNLDPTNETFCTWDLGKLVVINYKTKQVYKISCDNPSGSVICSPISPSKRPTIVALEYVPEKDLKLNREYQARVQGSSTAIKIWRPTWLGSGWNQYHCESKIQLKPIGSRLSAGGSRLVLFFNKSIEIFRTDNPANPPFRFDVTQAADHLKIKSSYIKFYQSQAIGNRKVGTKKNIEIMLVPSDKTDRTGERQKVHILWNLLNQCYTCDSPLLEQVTESEPIAYIYNPPRKIKRAATVADHTTAPMIDSLKEEKQRLEDQLADQKADGDQLQRELNQATTEKDRLITQVSDLEAQLSEASTAKSDKLAELTAQLETATSATTEHQKRVEALEHKLAEAQAAQTELERAQAELKEKRAEVERLARDKDETDSELQNARAKVTELEEKVKQLETQAARIADLETRLADAQREYEALRQSGDGQEAMARKLNMITSLLESQQTEEGERRRQEESLTQKNDELEQLRGKLAAMAEQVAEAETRSELLASKEQVLNKREAALKRKTEEFKGEIATEASTLDSERTALYETVNSDREKLIASHQAELEKRLLQQEEEFKVREDALKALLQSRSNLQDIQEGGLLAGKDAEIKRLTTELDKLRSGQSSAHKDLQRREEELNQRKREVEDWAKNRQKELNDWAARETKRLKAEIEEERKAQEKEQKIWVQRKEVEFREQDEELRGREQQLANNRSIYVSQVTQKEIEFNAWQERLVTEQQQLAQEDADLAKKTRETEANLKQQANDLDDREETLDERETLLTQKEEALREREAKIAQRETTHTQRILETSKASGGAIGLHAIIEQRDETITDLQQQLASLRAQLELQQAGVAASPAATNETDQEVVELQRTVDQRKGEISELQTTLTDKNTTISRLEEQLTRLSMRLSELQQLDEPAASPTSDSARDTDSVRSVSSAASPRSATSRRGKRNKPDDKSKVKHLHQWR